MNRRLLVLIPVTVVLATVTGSWAYWTTSGSGAASAGVGTLNPPPQPVLTYTGGTTVKVDWTPGSTLSDGITPAQGYYVTRYNGSTTSPACGTSPASLTTSKSCTDSSVPDGTYTYRVIAVWNSFSETSSASAAVIVDATPPTNSLSLTGKSGGGSFLSATTLYYQGSVAGSFAIQNAVSDSGSGPASSAFPALGGTMTGWTHTGSTVTTPAGGPYVSTVFSWTASTSSSPSETVTGADVAGNTTATALTLTNDSTAPSGGSVSVPTYSKTTSVEVTFSAGTDGGSGVNAASGQLKRATGTLSSGSCSSFGSFENVGSEGQTSPFTNTGLENGKCYEYEYVVSDNVGNSVTYGPSTPVKVDTTAPSGSISYTNGYNNTGTVEVTFSATDTGSGVNAASGQLKRATATLTSGTCGTFGGFENVGSAGPTSPFSNTGLENGKCYEYEYVVSDNAGNQATITSESIVKVDTTPPTNSLSLTSQTGGGSYLTGTTLYYRGTVSGSFAIQNAVSDNGSGPASSALPALGGTTTRWAHTTSTATEPSGGPYVSSAFSWTASATTSPTEAVTGADKAGNTATTTLTFANDQTAPAGGSVTYADGYNTTGTVALTFSTGTDAGSGINTGASRLKRAAAPLSAGKCGTFGSFENIGSEGVSSSYNDSSVATNTCYKYEYVVSDNVGNSIAYTSANVVEVDTTPPANSLSLTSQTGGGSYLSATTLYYRGTIAGSFKLINTISDSGSASASSAFPALAGTTTGWTHAGSTVTGAGPAYTSTVFEWAAATSSSPTETVTGADKAGNTTPTTLTFTSDTTAPSGGSVSVPAYSHETTVQVTFSAGSDEGSGVDTAAGVLKRGESTYTPSTDTCAAITTFKNVETGPTSPAASTVANNKCYRYQYVASDRVGNTTTYESGTLKVDTTGPSVTAIKSEDPGGAVATGKLVNGATLTLTFGEAIDPATVASGCPSSCVIAGAEEKRGASGNVFLVIPGITTSGGSDTGSAGYLAGTGVAAATFTATVAFPSSNVLTITVSNLGGSTTAASEGKLKFAPAPTITDLAGNDATGTFETARIKLF